MTEDMIYHKGLRDGIELMWAIVRDVDATQPEYPMPFELFRRYKTAVGKVDDYMYARKETQDVKNN